MNTAPDIALIAAVARNGVIGRRGGMPWQLPSDLRHFRALTMGKPVIMGRRTFEGLGKPLAGRTNIVVTRDPSFAAAGVTVAGGVDPALAAGRAAAGDGNEIMVIGGGSLYAALIGRADRLYISHVDAAPEGDTFFPPIDPAIWEEISSTDLPRTERDSADVRFAVYTRRKAAGT
jgi:dihydrofolate reductase